MNYEGLPPVGEQPYQHNFAEDVQALLDDQEIQQLPEVEQGRFIMDRFVGQVVANGTVYGSEALSPLDTLERVEMAAAAYGRLPESDDVLKKATKVVTRTDGLRDATALLLQDSRTGGRLHGLAQSLRVNGQGEFTFTSVQQLEGYVNTKMMQNRDKVNYFAGGDWESVLYGAVKDHVTSDRTVPARWDTAQNASSEIASVRQDQNNYQQAERIAADHGIDVELVKRSAEVMKNELARNEFVGQTALSHTVGVDRISQMFR